MIGGIPVMEFTGPAALAMMSLLVITDKLIWHTRLSKAEAQRDKWEQVALRALGVADKMTIHAEVANEIVSKLPDPSALVKEG